ncbi:unnamed protein product [Boreogadus saida]
MSPTSPAFRCQGTTASALPSAGDDGALALAAAEAGGPRQRGSGGRQRWSTRPFYSMLWISLLQIGCGRGRTRDVGEPDGVKASIQSLPCPEPESQLPWGKDDKGGGQGGKEGRRHQAVKAALPFPPYDTIILGQSLSKNHTISVEGHTRRDCLQGAH